MQASVISEKIPEENSAPPKKNEEAFTPSTEVFMELRWLEKKNDNILSKEDKIRITRDILVNVLSLRYSKRKVIDLVSELIDKGYCSCKKTIVVTTRDGREAHRIPYVKWEKQREESLKKKREI